MVTNQRSITFLTSEPSTQLGIALQSLRRSDRALSAVVAELIDNSIEAGAGHVQLIMQAGNGAEHLAWAARTRSTEPGVIVAVIDNGRGMDAAVLHRHLQLDLPLGAGSSHNMVKRGIGAKLAALDCAQRIDVWSRADTAAPWLWVSVDLHTMFVGTSPGEIAQPQECPVPAELAPCLPAGTGTLVMWSGVHASSTMPIADLHSQVASDLARMYRYALTGGTDIRVGDNRLIAHDPLFLLPNTWANKVLSERAHPGQHRQGKRRAGHLAAQILARREEICAAGAVVYLTVTVYPRNVVRERGMGGDALARMLRIPDNKGRQSIVRMDREIAYTRIPALVPGRVQAKDRFIGVEIAFDAEHDESVGMRDMKRAFAPPAELCEAIRRRLGHHVGRARKEIDAIWQRAARDACRSAALSRRFAIELAALPSKRYFEVDRQGRHMVLRLNTRHPMHKAMLGKGRMARGDLSTAQAKAVLDHLVQDLMTVLDDHPEAATMKHALNQAYARLLSQLARL